MAVFASAEVATLFADRAFRQIWLVGALSGIARWLEMLAVGVFVFDVTGSPFLVAFMLFLRMLPMAILGAMIGVMAERIPLRSVLLFGLAVMFLTSAVLAVLAWADRIEVWHLGFGAVLSGTFWVTDQPVRRNMLGIIGGPARAAQAMSLDAATGSITRALGPAIGGLLLAVLGLEGALGLSVLLYGICLFIMFGLTVLEPAARDRVVSLWRDIREGIAFVRRDRAIVGALVVTIVFNVWAFPYTAMIPVIGREDLALGSFAVGLLMSAEGAGAFLGAMIVALTARPARYRHIYYFGTAVCLSMILVFSLSAVPGISGIAILIAGIGAGCFSSMQSTIIFLSAPRQVRSRLLGLLSVCIGTAPIGFLHIGWMADVFGAPMATAATAAEGLAVLILLALFLPVLRPMEVPQPEDGASGSSVKHG